jgi:uncharacterized protein YfcZ (UPF0381/DUF406 family)
MSFADREAYLENVLKSLTEAHSNVLKENDTLHQQLAEAQAQVKELEVSAKYAVHIDATPENQRETMLYDALIERDNLRQQLAEAQALAVTNIMVDVVPGDGSGFEVYARSVSDVEKLLTNLSEKAENYESETISQRHHIAMLEARIEASRKQVAVAGMYGGTKVNIGAPDASDISYGWNPLYAAPVVADDVLKDALRYRFLRTSNRLSNKGLGASIKSDWLWNLDYKALDAAIDAAMGGAA